MEPSHRPNFQLAGAGGVLFGYTAACIVLGALVGWAVGSAGIGILFGAFVGIPAASSWSTAATGTRSNARHLVDFRVRCRDG